MVSYNNETKVMDIPKPALELEVKELLRKAIFDYGSDMKKDLFEHSYNRLAYIISLKYKTLILGEVKYVFECMFEHIKGKLSVSTIMQLFARYTEAKIEKQRQEILNGEIEYDKNIHDCSKSPLGSAIIHKITTKDDRPIKEIAEDIKSGKINFKYSPDKKNKRKWE